MCVCVVWVSTRVCVGLYVVCVSAYVVVCVCVCLAVPAAVGEVSVSNSGRSDLLQVSWLPAEGAVDSYQVQIKDRDKTVHTRVVSKASPPECVFNSLTPGRLYTISIATRSGGLENNTLVHARTRG